MVDRIVASGVAKTGTDVSSDLRSEALAILRSIASVNAKTIKEGSLTFSLAEKKRFLGIFSYRKTVSAADALNILDKGDVLEVTPKTWHYYTSTKGGSGWAHKVVGDGATTIESHQDLVDWHSIAGKELLARGEQ